MERGFLKKIESVLIAGAGAVGLMLAEKVFETSPEFIYILAMGERLERYKNGGLFINGEKIVIKLTGDFQPKPFDLIIIASKFYHLKQIISDIKPFVGKDTIIVSLLNGITSEEIISTEYGKERVPLAMILKTDAQHKGNQVKYTRLGIINFGDSDGKICERDERLVEFFTRISYPFEYHKNDMKHALWYKFMMNTGFNQTSALLRLPFCCFKRNSPKAIEEAQKILEKAMREVMEISVAEGINLNDSDLENCMRAVDTLDDYSYTSMCQDVMNERETEVELFGSTVCEFGRKHHILTPVNEMLALSIRSVEQSYKLKEKSEASQ